MTAIAVTERTVDAPLSVAFEQFVDFSRWDLWMPKNFRPVAGPARALRVGDALKIGVGPRRFMTLNIEVIRVRPNKEVCWAGGKLPVIRGEHSFLFSEKDGKTVVRSEETVSGALANGPLVKPMEKACLDVGNAVLTQFAEYLTRRKA